ncbi:Zn-ribbon domain-containing OB-fold protein [Candidatus Woesearchaeota archaeon]|nr:Zn-ribbon domain-containing OB-fold protein [Candidatus Woesearchaeota archaeon]
MTVPKIWRKIPEMYNLKGRICPECNSYFFPPREFCTKCGNEKMEDYFFQGIGKIISFTIIRTPVSDPENENMDIAARNIPYVLAIIELAEGPRLTAQVVDCRKEDVEIGKDVEMVFRKIMEKGEKGVIQYGYKFRLA